MKLPKLKLVALIISCVSPMAVSAQTNYTNALTNPASLNSDFLFIEDTNQEGNFIPQSSGLEFTTGANPFFASYVYTNQILSASNSWAVSVQVGLGTLLNGTNDAWIFGGLSLFKYNSSLTNVSELIAYAQEQGILNAKFVRTQTTNNSLTNIFVSKFEARPFGIYGEDYMATQPPGVSESTNLWVRMSYAAPSKTLSYAFSRDGINFSAGPSWNLADRWSVSDSSQFAVGVSAENASIEQPNQVFYSVPIGQLSLRNFAVSFTSVPRSGDIILQLQSRTNLSLSWSNLAVTSEMIDGGGRMNLGPTVLSNSFYRTILWRAP
jgi:hypothetical protein